MRSVLPRCEAEKSLISLVPLSLDQLHREIASDTWAEETRSPRKGWATGILGIDVISDADNLKLSNRVRYARIKNLHLIEYIFKSENDKGVSARCF